MDPISQIAQGNEPAWEDTFDHPVHGKLTFRVQHTPTNADWLKHAAVKDALIRAQNVNPDDVGSQTSLLAAACAGVTELMQRPMLDERRTLDPDVEGHEHIERILYDPLTDDNLEFPLIVWASFFAWRSGLLDRAGELKNSSGESGGSEPDEPSHEATLSPSTIPA